jgi:hypothetical protein
MYPTVTEGRIFTIFSNLFGTLRKLTLNLNGVHTAPVLAYNERRDT